MNSYFRNKLWEPLKIKDSHELIDKREYADIIYRNQSQKGVDYETARII